MRGSERAPQIPRRNCGAAPPSNTWRPKGSDPRARAPCARVPPVCARTLRCSGSPTFCGTGRQCFDEPVLRWEVMQQAAFAHARLSGDGIKHAGSRFPGGRLRLRWHRGAYLVASRLSVSWEKNTVRLVVNRPVGRFMLLPHVQSIYPIDRAPFSHPMCENFL